MICRRDLFKLAGFTYRTGKGSGLCKKCVDFGEAKGLGILVEMDLIVKF
jgi:hypothetical protein